MGGLTLFRWFLLIIDMRNVICWWNAIDCCFALLQALWVAWNLCAYHHSYRWLGALPRGDVAKEDITHVLAVLHATEPAEQLYQMVSDLKKLTCQGKKILMVGMEAGLDNKQSVKDGKDPGIEDRIKKIAEDHGDGFSEILYTVHTLRP